ncbi:MAG: phosphodiester glycosidase family protein [Alphaproteobacteria bacterium]|nr:phosphodiester glycosidase family protein [Alphaproteobacteria bacterium]
MVFEGHGFTACTVDATTEDLRLFHRDAGGAVLGGWGPLTDAVKPGTLRFAMNAGMYHADRRAVGLYIQDFVETAPLVTRKGPGNFGLLPNGVFCVTDDSARVIESLACDAARPACRDASQSGPMLVIDGALHPRFIPDSPSVHIRNGVGTSADGRTAIFAISNDPVNFHTFARFFRDALETPNALFFDGSVSRLYAPGVNRADFGFAQLGPMVGVVE